ncbi:hypothetical protein ACHWQZ_G012593 [Mnemiopsis leidyi]
MRCNWQLSAAQEATATALTLCGTGFGGIFLGPLSDRHGRKPTAAITSLILFLSMITTSFSPNFVFFLFFGIVGGLCVGGSLSIAYTFWAEVSSQNYRAAGFVVITMFWNSGLAISNGFALLVLNRIGWRIFTALMSLPAVMAVLIISFLPESPKFLNRARKDDPTKLMNALRQKLRSANVSYNLSEVKILREPGSDQGTTNETTITRSFATIFGDELRKDTLKILAIYSCLQVLYKGLLYVVTGIFAKDFCGLTISDSALNSNLGSQDNFSNCDTLSNGDLMNGVLLSVALYPSTVISVYMAEKIGESKTLKLFAVACFVFCTVMLICLPTALFFINIGLLIFSVAGMSLILYMVLPQMYPTVVRNSGFGLVDGVGKLVASIGVFVITAALESSVRGAIGILVLICLLIIVQSLLLRVRGDLKDNQERTSESNGYHEKDKVKNSLPHLD